MKKHLCQFAHREPCVPYKTIVERMIGSTSSYSNEHGVVDDKNNNNCHGSMLIDTMRMNQGDVDECSIVNEKQNANTTRFFDLLKYFDEPFMGWVHKSQ